VTMAPDADRAPRCANVIGNDWSSLVPDRDTSWAPSARVSICIPTHNPGPGLARMLRCLDAQTYPADLIDIIIGDDRSEVPVGVPDGLRHHVSVVRCEHDLPFGAGVARHAAASAATGDILMFLDADVIPERHVVEAYARWFDRCPLVVPMGLCRFVETDALSDDDLYRLVDDGTMARHFAEVTVDDQYYRERRFELLDDLRTEAIDAFRVAIGATIAVSAEQYAQVGGFPTLGVRGAEDTTFGHRLHTNGAIFVLDRDATHWHQGRRTLSDPATRERVNQIRAPFLESLLPIGGFRGDEAPTDPPVEVVPTARVRVRGDDTEATRHSVEAVPDIDAVVTDTVLGDAFDPAFVQVDLPAGIRWSSATAKQITTVFADHPVGVVKALVDGTEGEIITIARSRAIRRARLVRPDEEPTVVAGELFGVWWVDAATLSLVPFGQESTVDLAAASGWTSRLYDLVVAGLRRLAR